MPEFLGRFLARARMVHRHVLGRSLVLCLRGIEGLGVRLYRHALGPYPWLGVRMAGDAPRMSTRHRPVPDFSRPALHCMRVHAAMDLLRWAGVEVVPGLYWDLLRSEIMPAAAIRALGCRLGCNVGAVRRRDPMEMALLDVACRLAIREECGQLTVTADERLYLCGLRLLGRRRGLRQSHALRLELVDALARLADIDPEFRTPSHPRVVEALERERRWIIGGNASRARVTAQCAEAAACIAMAQRWQDATHCLQAMLATEGQTVPFVADRRLAEATAPVLRQLRACAEQEFPRILARLEAAVLGGLDSLARQMVANDATTGPPAAVRLRRMILTSGARAFFGWDVGQMPPLEELREQVLRRGMAVGVAAKGAVSKASQLDFKMAVAMYESVRRAVLDAPEYVPPCGGSRAPTVLSARRAGFAQSPGAFREPPPTG